MDVQQKNDFEELLGTDFAQAVVRDLGIENSTPAAQASMISGIGEDIMKQLIARAYSRIPDSDHPTIEKFLADGDGAGLRLYLEAHIPDFDSFVRRETREMYETIKKEADEIARKRGATG